MDDITLNTDESVDVVRHGHGGVLYDSKGVVKLTFAGNVGNSTVLEQKLRAIDL